MFCSPGTPLEVFAFLRGMYLESLDVKSLRALSLNDFAARHGITYYNFNLYNRKLELLPDDTAFYDETHLNDYGAEEFSKLFGRLMADRAAGKDIDWQFYKTYADLDYFSDYWNS